MHSWPGTSKPKLRVVFVGAFKEAAQDGAVGGSLFAARSLVASPLANYVDWVLVDSTARSVPPPGIPLRALLASLRMVKFAILVVQPTTDATLIFAGSHLGFAEKGLMALFSKAVGKPVLFSPRSGLMLDAISESALQRWFVPAVLTRCDRILCQGDTWRNYYRGLTGLPDHQLVSIPNWVNLADYPVRPSPRVERRPIVFLYMGWLERYKGVIDLIRAFHLYRGTLPDARLTICGRGTALSEVRQLVDELGLAQVVDLPGWVIGDRKRAILSDSDVLVLPSYREGLPNTLLEAMAAGLPVIASRAGAIPDVVEHGKSGLLFEAGDVDALGRALVRLARNPQERGQMARVARKKIAADHDIAVAWPRVLKELCDVVKQR